MGVIVNSKEELKRIVDSLKSQGKTVVTTNGVFDILHVGHLRILKKARELGDALIVLLNSDSSVKQFKGDKRPIHPEQERAEILSHLNSVDYITLFSEDTPLNLLKFLQPDIHTKGGTFISERIKEEKELLESWGGQFKTLELEEGYSSTNVIQKVLEVYSDQPNKP